MTDTVPLDEKTAKHFEQRLAQLDAVTHALNGALSLLIAQQGLEGQWRLDWPHRCLVPVNGVEKSNGANDTTTSDL